MKPRLPFLVVILSIALAAAGCAAPSGTLDEGARQEELAPALLTEDDVRSIPEAPAGLEHVQPEAANLSEDPDQRGPCGAEIEALPILDGALTVFGTDDLVITNIVLAETGGLAERFVAATIADLDPGCPAYTKEETPFGEPQVTELLGQVDLGDLGDESVAYHVLATVGDEEAAYGVQSVVRVGDALSVVVILSSTRMPDELVVGLTSAAAARLAAFGS